MVSKQPAGNDASYYSEHFTQAELADLDRALGESLTGEIDMLRVMMRRFFILATSEKDNLDALKNALQLLGLSCSRLARVIQTEQSLQDKQTDELGDSLTRAMSAVLEEMGSAGLTNHDEEAQNG